MRPLQFCCTRDSFSFVFIYEMLDNRLLPKLFKYLVLLFALRIGLTGKSIRLCFFSEKLVSPQLPHC